MLTLNWENAAEQLVGTTVVVEIQHQDAQGIFMRHDHAWGVITSADRKNGVRIQVAGKTFNGKLMVLPADLSSFTKPQSGLYRLSSTGEQVTDPHWFTTWVVKDAKAVQAQRVVQRPKK